MLPGEINEKCNIKVSTLKRNLVKYEDTQPRSDRTAAAIRSELLSLCYSRYQAWCRGPKSILYSALQRAQCIEPVSPLTCVACVTDESVMADHGAPRKRSKHKYSRVSMQRPPNVNTTSCSPFACHPQASLNPRTEIRTPNVTTTKDATEHICPFQESACQAGVGQCPENSNNHRKETQGRPEAALASSQAAGGLEGAEMAHPDQCQK
ncbi:hypothetical protein B0T21DRAFT_364620 [Apiosordaria backusii]|uniref:Uncharacterized protein n=1 Tax=Apiosordaria backusii TaxID=314023 RepID=A0AA40EG46_9PEZI|nr:hypothetical protein B0T21DRAFT_364620 [Apiosordaria backusii]